MEGLYKKWETLIPQFIQSYKGVIVACSGGVDSTVLFHLLWKFTNQKINFPLAIFHMNFGLRGKESNLDQEFLVDLAERTKTPLFMHKIEDEEAKPLNQAQARSLRYSLLKDYAKKGWVIAFAHHEDDLAENIILRLARGTSPASAMGMKEWNPPYWRPLLDFGKAEIQAWAIRQNLPHRHDASNDTIKYSRNRIRHLVIPELESLYPGASKRMVRCYKDLDDIVAFAFSKVTPVAQTLKTQGLPMSNLQGFPDVIIKHILSCAIGRRKEKPINHNLLENILNLIKKPGPQKEWSVQIADDLFFVHKKGEIFFKSR